MDNRVKIQNLVQDQVPDFVSDSYPEFVEFLRAYYKDLESPGSPLDIVNNIDQYTQLNNVSEIVYSTELTSSVGYSTKSIEVTSTEGFPPRDGLVQIGNEIIRYDTKTLTSFDGCVRGFVGFTSYVDNIDKFPTFLDSNKEPHSPGDTVFNLNSLFIAEIYKKYKRMYAPGFDNVQFYEEVNEKNAVARLKDFYASKGANSSFDLLFRLIWGVDVKVVKPRDFLIQPSDADYRITRDLVVKPLLGDPQDLVNRTLFQDETTTIQNASGTITDVEQIFRSNEVYYKMSLDYNPDLETFVFSVHPKTKITNPVGAGQTYLDVDSTLSFENEGTLVFYDNDVEYQIQYSGKNTTQFFGLQSPIAIPLNADITTPDYAYATDDDGNEIRVKVTGVLGELVYDREKSYYYQVGDQIQIVSLGSDSEDQNVTSWVLNSTPEYEIEQLTQVALKLNGAAQYRVRTYDPHIFTLGDIGTVKGSDGNQYDVFVIAVSDRYEFDINLTTQVNTTSVKYNIRKGISKANSVNNPELNIFSSNVSNVYIKDNDRYVTSNSLPDYYNTPITIEDLSVTFSGQFDGFDINIGTNGFITGDAIYYNYNNNIGLDIQEGQYFVYKANASTIRLATSRSNIRSGIFIRVFGTVFNNKFELLKFKDRIIKSQSLIRKFSHPIPYDNYEETITSPGNTGMFLNGVELLNYKSSDTLYYGKIEEIVVSSPGDKNYDIINPPVLSIDDNIGVGSSIFGSGAEGVCNVRGSLTKIDIIDKGFDYVEEPKVTISGGNGIGAEAKCKLSKITHSVSFNAGSLYENVNLSNNTIGFSTFHKFRDYEKVLYSSQSQTEIGGLVNDSIYFVKDLDGKTIKLYNTADDAIVGVNTINFTAYGDGLQKISAFEKKNVISSIEVISGGSGYTNKTLYFNEDHVDIYSNTIVYPNHGYTDREIVRISTDDTLPVGLNSTSEYYVNVVDSNRFKVAEYITVGIGSTLQSDFNYVNKRFVNFGDGGTGTHNITYRPIEVKLEAPIGVTTTSGQNFAAKISPIFTGEIISISLKTNGNNYGDASILNYNRQPNIQLNSGVNAQLTPIVSAAGRIIGVIVNNVGSGYNSPPNIEILGSGDGAVLTPVIEDGKLTEVKIIESGFGYKQVDTILNVIPTGSGATFTAKIKSWSINLVERIIQAQKINPDDGIITSAITSDAGLQYTHGYLGRELRRKLLSTSLDNDGNTIYRDDIDNDTNSTLYHSPIVGWSYDGHPIYGPYGYADKEGGAIKRLNSGYSLILPANRPSTGDFPAGIFVEDYQFVGDGDLDIHNGRYCKTPEYPNGVYAYFSTINSTPEASGPLNGYLKPVFPYVIGDSYKSKPVEFNFSQFSSLDYININDSGWTRYTGKLGLLSNRTSYSGFLQPDQFAEGFTEIRSVTPGSVTKLNLVAPGDNYSLADSVFFDNVDTSGSGAYARISELAGKTVDSVSYEFDLLKSVQFVPSISDGRFIGIGSTDHNLKNGDIVSIQNLNILSTEFSKSYNVGISTNNLTLSTNVGDSASSGIVTYFNVSGNLVFPALSVNDLYLIGDETVKVLNVYQDDSRIKVQRAINGTSDPHFAGSNLKEKTRKLIVNTGFTTSTEYQLDTEYYFDPRESVIIPSENLILYSNPVPPELVSAWDYYTVGVGTGTVSYYSATAPDGSNDVAKVSFASTTGTGDGFGIEYSSTSLSATNHTISVFLKGNAGGEEVYIIVDDGLAYYSSKVTLTRFWRRYSFQAFTGSGSHTLKIGTYGPQTLTSNTSPTFYVWGAQIETGTLRSTLYETNGSALSRSADVSGLLSLSNPGVTQKELIKSTIHSFYLPSHGFKTGDLLTYNVGSGFTGVKVSTGTTQFPLEDGTKLYAAVYDADFIGISTQQVGVGSTGQFVGVGSEGLLIYDLVDYGTGEIHSFNTNKTSTIVGDVYKKYAKVTTKINHGLTEGDQIVFNAVSGIQTTVTVAYDDLNRRMVINQKSFIDSDVDIDRNSITIPNHGFKNGAKVIYNSPSPSVGLTNAQIYYVIVLDDNTISLSDYYYDVITSNESVQIIDIETQSLGFISEVNPEIFCYRNSTVIFDLSDQTLAANSLPAFNFFLYTDENFSDEFFTTEENTGDFNVKTSGTIGEPGAKLELIIDENVPTTLYYNLEPIRYNGAAASKLEIISDNFNIKNPNKLSVSYSKFNLKANVTGVTSATFNYPLLDTPEKILYPNNEALLSYTTTSLSAIGPVAKVSLDSIGRNYRKLPNIAEIVSIGGTGAIFLPASTNLGQVDEVVLTDIGFDYPSDKTLNPAAQFPYTYKIEPLSKFSQIKIVNPGINYFVPPQLVVLDGFTGRVNTEASLKYDIGDTEVTIVRNTTGLYNITPKILPINNPNGIRIDDITYDPGNYNVTIGFAVTFTTAEDYPFKVGDKVIVENTNIDATVNGTGYNSSDFGYALFTLTAIDPNIGGETPTITYNLQDYLKPGQVPGNFDSFDSFGTVTPESYFPQFDIDLAKDSFRSGEIIVAQDDNRGVVQFYDFRNEYLRVRSKIPFKVDDLIIGQSSQNQGLISSVDGISGKYLISSNSITKKGFLRDTGKLNYAFQRVHDNDYYQYFSYSIRSSIDYKDWNPLVSALTHTSGFKKFSELVIDSYDPSIVGITTAQDLNVLIAISDLTQVVDLNTVRDFDIGREKSIDVSGDLVSNEILFNLPFLAQYQEFIGNRVLAVDDFSDQFNGEKRDFELFSDGNKVFEIEFSGNDATKISVGEGTIDITNHYFVSGELVQYIPPNNDFANAIQITPTDFGPGIGTTSLLPSQFYIIKQDNQKVRVATSATNALLFNPIGVGLTGVGIGSTHIFRAIEPNNRMLITINGTIQSPMVGTAYTVALASTAGIGSTVIDMVGVTSVFGGDLVRFEDEVVLIAAVDNVANTLTVRRGWMGTAEVSHSAGVVGTKQVGNFNVVNNDLHLIEGPWGNIPVGLGTTALNSGEVDYTGLTTSSRFSGRIFLRSALNQAFTTSFLPAYDNNYVYDDISDQFNGINTSFYLKYNGNDIDNISAQNTIVLIDDIFQGPQRLGNVLTNIEGDYKLEGGGGQLLLGFNGEVTDPNNHNDINVNRVPRGGVIVSVASKAGYGYQPLVSAGGTAVVSAAGTITAIAIGNTGSGYRSGLQTVSVGIETASYGAANITAVGVATVVDGHVIGVAITNPQVFYAPREVANIGYSSVTGITTVTTSTPHNLSLGDEVQVVGAAFTCDYYPPVNVTNALYDNVTGIMTVTVGGASTLTVNGFFYDNVTGLATVTTVEPHKFVPQTAIGRSFSLAGLALTCVGYGQTFGVYDFTYDNITGLATVFTIGDHGLSNGETFKMRELAFNCPVGGPTGYGQTFTITQFQYDNVTGLSTVTTSSSFIGVIGIGSDIRLDNLEFTCPGGSGITTTIFPDGTQGYTFTVTNIIASDQFEINVGPSTISHTYVENDAGQVTAGLTTSIFPDGTQGYFFDVVTVGTTTSFTVNVGPSTISHTYASGGVIQVGINTNIFPGNSVVSPLGDIFGVLSAPDSYTLTFNAGISTIRHEYVSGGSLTVGHKLKVGTDVILTGLAFTCSYDGGVGILTHPRITDPTYCGTQVTRMNSLYDFEINVGVTTAESFYNSGGIVEEIILAPRQINNSPTGQDPGANGTAITKIVDDYTFIINSGPSPYTHAYKRCGEVRRPLDVVFDAPLTYYNIPLVYHPGESGFGTGATVDLVPSNDSTILNFEINNFGYGYGSGERLTVAIGGTVGIPTFATITSNAVTPVFDGANYYSVTDATYDPVSGNSTLTIGIHTLTTADTVRIANKSLLFRCASDDYSAILAYPRPGIDSNIANQDVGITSYTSTTITVFAGSSPVGKQFPHTFVGLATYLPFELTIDRTFQSKFSGWNVGEFIVLDEIDPFFNGARRLFPLSVNGESISFFAKANSGINLQSNLLVFVNDILQTPGEGYQFNGGSTLRFTEAPKGGVSGFSTTGDKAKIFMYTGTQTIDVRTVDVLPSVEVGDEVQLYSNVDTTFTQDPRLVMDIKAADKVITNNYAGQGVTLNELFERPLSWTKQTVDKIIDNNYIGKDRVYYEPIINPSTNIISNVGLADSSVYVYSIRPLFDNPFEGISVQDRSVIEIISGDELVPATVDAVLGVGGSVSNLLITNPGYGYTSTPDVTIQKPYDNGTQAIGGLTIGAGGSVTTATVSTGGTNYYYGPLKAMSLQQQGSGFPPVDTNTNFFRSARLKTESGIGFGAVADIEISTINFNVASFSVLEGGTNYQVGDTLFVDTYDNVGLATTSRKWALGAPIKFKVIEIEPPEVLVAPPKRAVEECQFITFEGDYGIIVGVGTTTIGAGTSLGVALDLFIPFNSEIREGLSITLPGITTGDLFNITKTNFIGAAQTSLGADGSIVGVSTIHADMMCECIDYYTKQSVVPAGINGLGTTVGFGTTVTTVIISLQSAGANNVVGLGTTAYYGEYTWGKIGLPVRTTNQVWNSNHGVSQAGIVTNPVIRRKNPLKYLGYLN